MKNKNISKNIQEVNRLQRDIKREKMKARKQRTRRLIVTGALAEKYLGVKDLSVEETEFKFKQLYNYLNKK